MIVLISNELYDSNIRTASNNELSVAYLSL